MRIAVLHARLMRGLQRYCRLHAFRVLSRPLMGRSIDDSRG